MYGTTTAGGGLNRGIAYEVSPSGLETTLYTFGNDDEHIGSPEGGLVFDAEDNLYGTTVGGDYSRGPLSGIFELVPSGQGWTFDGLHVFFQGERQSQSLIFGHAGELFGTYSSSAISSGGAVYELSPFRIIESFSGSGGPIGGSLFMDAAGNLYGTTCADGANQLGNVFSLSPSNGGGWTYTSLYDFTGGNDGSCPYGTVAMDAHGNLYGTASSGGSQGFGVVWEITP
jgi:uncharacterized repeat protein (TIGR03803 family)